MNTLFYIGFMFGMVGMLTIQKVLKLLRANETSEDVPVPVIHDTRLYPTRIVADKIVHREEVAIFVDDYWKERAFSDVKDKLAVDVIKHAKFTWIDDPKNFDYKLRGEIMVFSDKPHMALNNDLI